MITVTDSHVWMMGGVWGLLVLAGLWSLNSRGMAAVKKIAWALGIICLPVVGLLLYSLSCLFSEDWEVVRRLGFLSPSKKRIIDSINVSQP